MWCLITDVSEHCVCSETSVKWLCTRLRRWNRHNVPKRRLLSGYPLAYEDGTDSVPKRWLLSGYPLAYEDGTHRHSVPERRLLSGYPLAYEDGTVFRNVGY